MKTIRIILLAFTLIGCSEFVRPKKDGPYYIHQADVKKQDRETLRLFLAILIGSGILIIAILPKDTIKYP